MANESRKVSVKAGSPDAAMRMVTENRRARMRYTIEETLEAGLALVGSEVKGLRDGTTNLSDAYAVPKGSELFLHNARIGTPKGQSTTLSHDPLRQRKLLMHRAELDRWAIKVRERGYSIIPLMLYFKGGRAKVQLGLCKGKAHEDRREDIKARETQRELDRAVRRR
jgi:SsrA-binding protein